MTPTAEGWLPNLPERLERQALNVEGEGWITAARLMREAAAEIRAYRAPLPSSPGGGAGEETNVEPQCGVGQQAGLTDQGGEP